VKALVVYYSNSGTTRTVATRIAETLGADMEEIVERKHRASLLDAQGKPAGGLGMARAAMSAALGFGSSIEKGKSNPADYDLVVVGTPVWVGSLVPAVRSYLKHNRKGIKSVAMFCTCGQVEKLKAFKQMAGLVGQEPRATMAVSADDVKAGAFDEAVRDFAAGLAR